MTSKFNVFSDRPAAFITIVRSLKSHSRRDSSSRRIMRLAPFFILETNNQTNNECLPKFVQTENESSSVKTAIESLI